MGLGTLQDGEVEVKRVFRDILEFGWIRDRWLRLGGCANFL